MTKKTDERAAHDVAAHSIRLDVDGDSMAAYVALPRSDGPHAGILVLQEALGVNAQLREVADRYAAAGYAAIAPDLFHRIKPGYEATTIVMEEVMPLVRALTNEGLIADVKAAYDWLASQPQVTETRIAAVGFCMGGRAAFLANSELPLAAAISYYGGGIAPALLERAAHLHGAHLFFWGGIDQGIPPEQHRAVADALRAAHKLFVDVEFSDANHGFFNPEAGRYNAAAAAQSWAINLEFLRQYC